MLRLRADSGLSSKQLFNTLERPFGLQRGYVEQGFDVVYGHFHGMSYK